MKRPETIKNQFSEIKIESCESFNQLQGLMKKPEFIGMGKRIFVLFVDNETRLSQICSHAVLFEDEKVVALIPEISLTYLKKINRLYPRYLGIIGESSAVVCPVLKKMIES